MERDLQIHTKRPIKEAYPLVCKAKRVTVCPPHQKRSIYIYEKRHTRSLYIYEKRLCAIHEMARAQVWQTNIKTDFYIHEKRLIHT